MSVSLRPRTWFVAGLLAALLCGCAVRPAPPADAARTTTRPAGAEVEGRASTALGLDPQWRVGELDNGLKYYVRRNEKPETRAQLWLAVDAGSVLEDDDQRGLAHFVEHMAFNGTRHFAKHELVDYLERIGMRFGPDLNAYTSFDETVYMLQLPTDDDEILATAFVILADWAQGVTFEGEEIDKERGVVLEERRLGRGAAARMRDRQLPVIFKDSRYAERLTIGTEEVLQHAPHDALRRFYRDWYRPDLMALIAVGDFEPSAIERRIRDAFAGLAGPPEPRERVRFPVPDHDETLVAIATDPEATSTQVSIYNKVARRPTGTEADFRRYLAERLYHSMLNDRLDELRQRPEPPFLSAFSSSGRFVRTSDVLFQAARVGDDGLARGLEALLSEVERVDRHGFVATELARAKTQMLRSFEQAEREKDKTRSRTLAREALRHFLDGEPMPGVQVELALARRFLPEITLEQVNALVSESITETNRVIVVSAPEKAGLAPPPEEDLLAVFRAAEQRPLDPWIDTVRDEPLVGERPVPARIVEEREIAELGVTEWRLSNGVRVVLKPTDFKNDEIRFAAFSPGGHSLVPTDQYATAAFATAVLGAGGFGAFSRIELDKALAGKVVRVNPFIDELEEGVRGSASPQDVETLFELMYLTLTAPRVDEQAYESWQSRMRGYVENRLARPETVFSDEFRAVLSQSHPRRRPLSAEMLGEVVLPAAAGIYRARFADLGDATFVWVGNFDPAELRPLVLAWIGGLPSAGRVETWRDVDVRPPGEVVEFELYRGLEPKSQVRMTFTGDAEWSRENAHVIGSLAAALRIRLREVLREDMGGTYGVGVSGWISRRPREGYRFNVSFGCAPENVPELRQAVVDTIAAVKRDGLDDTYLSKVKESQLRKRETDLKENGFWLNRLQSAYRYGDDPRLMLEYDELVLGMTSEQLREAARRYLDDERYVIGLLYPEAAAPPRATGAGG